MNPSGYLGGDISMGDRYKLRDRLLAGRPSQELGTRCQCRCGGTVYTLWRRRWYCVRCARWVRVGIADFPAEATK